MVYHVLVVDDDPFQCKTTKLVIEKMLNYKVSTLNDGKQTIEFLLSPEGNNVNMVILDLSMPNIDGIQVLEEVKPQRPELPIIINTAYGDVQKAVEAIRKGAVDFIEKQDGPERMKVCIENVRSMSNLSKQVDKLSRFNDNSLNFSDIIGQSKVIEKTKNLAKKAAFSNIPVLLQGESGVGKELFARAIHSESIRGKKPFVAVNCSAIPKDLVESVLFGHEKGAFTGAVESSKGKFREAEGGTIFLDEIGELPLDTQAKLLRVLQNFEVEAVGSSKTYDVNVRVVSATNKNLEDEVEDGNFREDLFYRINVMPIKIPPLREREEDINLLTYHFTEKICAKENIKPKDIDESLLRNLQQYWWPGNIRQLENSIYRAIVLSENQVLTVNEFDYILDGIKAHNSDFEEYNSTTKIGFYNNGDEKFKTMAQFEKDIIQNALEFYNWNISKVSKILDIGRSTLYRKMKEYDIQEKKVENLSNYRKKA